METSEGLAGWIEYSTALYKPQTIERMAGHFIALCRAITAAPTARIRDLDYIGEAEKHKLLVAYNDTEAGYPLLSTTSVFMSCLLSRLSSIPTEQRWCLPSRN